MFVATQGCHRFRLKETFKLKKVDVVIEAIPPTPLIPMSFNTDLIFSSSSVLNQTFYQRIEMNTVPKSLLFLMTSEFQDAIF